MYYSVHHKIATIVIPSTLNTWSTDHTSQAPPNYLLFTCYVDSN